MLKVSLAAGRILSRMGAGDRRPLQRAAAQRQQLQMLLFADYANQALEAFCFLRAERMIELALCFQVLVPSFVRGGQRHAPNPKIAIELVDDVGRCQFLDTLYHKYLEPGLSTPDLSRPIER